MQTYTYTIRIHPTDADGTEYWVEVPALPGCYSRGATYEQALTNAREAITCYLEGLLKEGQPIPEEQEPVRELEAPVQVQLPEAV